MCGPEVVRSLVGGQLERQSSPSAQISIPVHDVGVGVRFENHELTALSFAESQAEIDVQMRRCEVACEGVDLLLMAGSRESEQVESDHWMTGTGAVNGHAAPDVGTRGEE